MKASAPEQRPEGFPGQRLVIIPPAIAAQASRRPVTRDLCVTHIGHFSAAGGHHVERPQGTPQHIVIACLSGKGSCVLRDQETNDRARRPAVSTSTGTSCLQCEPAVTMDDLLDALPGPAGERLPRYAGCLAGESRWCRCVDPAVLFEAFEDTFRHATHGFSEAAMAGLSTSFARLLGLAKVNQRSPGIQIPASGEPAAQGAGDDARGSSPVHGRSRNWRCNPMSASRISPNSAAAKPACRLSAC